MCGGIYRTDLERHAETGTELLNRPLVAIRRFAANPVVDMDG